MADTPDRLNSIVEECVNQLGLDLEHLDIRQSGKNRLVRVAVDTDGGVGIDAIADATRELSAALDADGAMGEQPYTLEVTSRGVDKPLTLPRHWRRNADRLVHAKMHDGSVVEGRIGTSDDEGVDIVTKAATRRIEFADVDAAHIQIELNPRKDV